SHLVFICFFYAKHGILIIYQTQTLHQANDENHGSDVDIKKALAKHSHIKISGCDIDGISRGKLVSAAKFLKTQDHEFGFCNVVFGWDCHDVVYHERDVPLANENSGYPDITARPDLSTLRSIPWEENTPLVLVDFYDPRTGTPMPQCPRGLLKRIIQQGKDLMGITAKAGIEYEFFNFAGYHTETGPGVYEVAISYTDPLSLADKAHLFKTATKCVGLTHGITPTFMAKPHQDLPGCSGHIHISLAPLVEAVMGATAEDAKTFVEQNSGNIFGKAAGDQFLKGMKWETGGGQAEINEHVSVILKWFLAGVLEGLPSVMALFAPTINSYKRLVENYWAPITVSYGVENRTTAIRLITPPTCPPAATRLEIRVPGADANPYLAIAAILACGYEGISSKMTLSDPPAETRTPEQRNKHERRLARDLREAVLEMERKDSFARKVLGDEFVDHFVGTRKHELRIWERAVTNWELKRYMEVV
ncbi:hypothetical protein HDU76_000400, partial [Blyttiomyces sp. JEL0837]